MIFDNSRYIRTAPVIREGSKTQSLRIRPRFSFNEDNATSYLWNVNDTLDGLATRFYYEPNLRWVILDANPQYRSEFDIKPGDVLLIPDYEEVVGIVDV